MYFLVHVYDSLEATSKNKSFNFANYKIALQVVVSIYTSTSSVSKCPFPQLCQYHSLSGLFGFCQFGKRETISSFQIFWLLEMVSIFSKLFSYLGFSSCKPPAHTIFPVFHWLVFNVQNINLHHTGDKYLLVCGCLFNLSMVSFTIPYFYIFILNVLVFPLMTGAFCDSRNLSLLRVYIFYIYF